MSTAARSIAQSGFSIRSSRPIRGQENRLARNGLVAMGDFLALLVGAVTVINLRFREEVAHRAGSPSVFWQHFLFAVVFSLLVVLCCHWQHLYRRYQLRSNGEIVFAMAKSCLMASFIFMSVIYVSRSAEISRAVVFGMLVSAFITGSAWRLIRRRVIAKGIKSGTAGRNVLIVGAGKAGRRFASQLEANKHFGYRVVGFLDAMRAPEVLGDFSDVRDIVLSSFVDEVIVAMPSDKKLVSTIAAELADLRVGLSVIPETFDGLGFNAPIEFVGHTPLMLLYNQPENSASLLAKRLMDIVFSLTLLLLCAPLMIAVAIAIVRDSSGSVFYFSERSGKKGRLFHCYKFRTMVSNADELRSSLVHLNERDGILFKIKKDPRITRVGAVLRKYSLDELPQLWNVLMGDMSLVGPRPALPAEVRNYAPEHARRMMVTPGITGLWQVQARENPSFDTYIDLDLQYVNQLSLWLDIKILAQTLFVVFAGTGS